MKALLFADAHYFRQKRLTIATAIRLAEEVSVGDVLYDVVTGDMASVAGLGFAPLRSDRTTYRTTWSREQVVTLDGYPNKCEGRISVDRDARTLTWERMLCSAGDKCDRVPMGIPLPCRLLMDDHHGIGVAVVLNDIEIEIVGGLPANCWNRPSIICEFISPLENRIAWNIQIIRRDKLPHEGAYVKWDDTDRECVSM